MRGVLVAALIAASVAACSGDDEAAPPTTGAANTTPATPTETAQQFIVRINQQMLKGQYGRAWTALHPAQQRFVGRSELTACMAGTTTYPPNVRFKPTESYNERYQVWGTKLTQPSTAVTIQVVEIAT